MEGIKGLSSKTIILIGIISLIIGYMVSYGMNISYAKDLVLVGRDKGLEIIPESRRLFNLTKLNPGDTYEANLTIENKYIAPFELFMRTERVSKIPKEGEADLFKQLLLTVYLGREEIYSGSMKDFAAANTSLGKFDVSDSQVLKAVVHLPGPETGNEFQGKSVNVKWIFIAQAAEPEPDKPKPEEPEPDKPDPDDQDKPAPPKTGDVIPMGFYGLGLGLLGLGIGLAWKRKK
ncbi:MAG: LPXTG cell wall anchor domain-containing protein [Clostridiales bacterium]|jgi:LPXTG-motif cell wall-anchored protein|nr:LPXTG cell wall anchor domain-containing protein [Clostridiales bacterium]